MQKMRRVLQQQGRADHLAMQLATGQMVPCLGTTQPKCLVRCAGGCCPLLRLTLPPGPAPPAGPAARPQSRRRRQSGLPPERGRHHASKV